MGKIIGLTMAATLGIYIGAIVISPSLFKFLILWPIKLGMQIGYLSESMEYYGKTEGMLEISIMISLVTLWLCLLLASVPLSLLKREKNS